jgi:toxin CptA
LALFVGLTHGLAAVAVVPLPIGLYRLPLLLLIVMSGAHAIYAQILMLAPWSIATACWQSDGTWLLTFVSGRQRSVSLSPATFVSQSLVVLNFQAGWSRRYALAMFVDALDREVMRRLRQRLGIEGSAEDSRSDAM